MEIVIDIPDRIFKMVCNNHRMGVIDCDVIHEAIASGIPLPKRHGRLIDADAFHRVVEEIPIKPTDKWFNWMQKTCVRLAEAPTIIEADKE